MVRINNFLYLNIILIQSKTNIMPITLLMRILQGIIQYQLLSSIYSMIQDTKNQQICKCLFQLQATECMANIKFPCSFFIEWKVSNSHKVASSNSCQKSVKGKILFKQKLYITTNMVYDLQRESYLKKESIITVNLVSNSRPNEPKLVGRIVVDLKEVANRTHFQELMTHSLQYCSVQGALTFKILLKNEAEASYSNKKKQQQENRQFSPIYADKYGQKSYIKSDYSSFQKQVFNVHNKDSIYNCINTNKRGQNFIDFVAEKDYYQKDEQNKRKKLKNKTQNKTQKKALQKQHRSSNRITQFINERKKKINTRNDLIKPVLLSNNQQSDKKKKEKQYIKVRNPSPQFLKDSNSYKIKDVQVIVQEPISIKDIEKYQKNIQTETRNQKLSQTYKLKLQLQALKKQNVFLHKQNQSQTLQLKSFAVKNAFIQQELQKMRKIIISKDEQLQNMLKPSNSEIMKLNKYLEEQSIRDSKQQYNINNFNDDVIEDQRIIQVHESIPKLQSELQLIEDPTLRTKQIKKLEKILSQSESKDNINKSNDNQVNKLKKLITKINMELQLMTQKLSAEMQDHKDTKEQLTEVRLWYNQIQKDIEKLQLQKDQLSKSLKNLQNKIKIQQKSVIQNNQQEKNNIINKKEKDIEVKDKKSSVIESQLLKMKVEIKLREQKINSCKENQLKIKNELKQTKKQFNELQLDNAGLKQQLRLQKQKGLSLQKELKGMQKSLKDKKQSVFKEKSEIIADQQNKINDLIQKLQDKQIIISKLTRDSENNQALILQLSLNIQSQKNRFKILENEKDIQVQKNKLCLKQNLQLKNKIKEDNQNYEVQILRRKNIEDEQKKKRQDIILLNKGKFKEKAQKQEKNNDLGLKIAQYEKNQKVMKENIKHFEEKVSQISFSLQEKQKNEEKLTEIIMILNNENKNLISRLEDLEDQCTTLIDINEGLSSQIQLLSNYNSEVITDNGQSLELNHEATDKNTNLQNSYDKCTKCIEKQISENEFNSLKINIQQAKNGYLMQKQQWQQKLYQLTLINQQLSQEKIQPQKKQVDFRNENNIEVKELKAEIQYLQSKMSESKQKIEQISLQSQKDRKIFIQNIDQQNNQLNYYLNQIIELKNNVKNAKTNFQQKQRQLYESKGKVEQLERQNQSLDSQMQLSKKQNQQLFFQLQQMSTLLENQKLETKSSFLDLKSKSKFQENEINKLEQKIKDYQSQIFTLKEKIQKMIFFSEQDETKINFLQQKDKSQKNCLDKLQQQLTDQSTQLNILQEEIQKWKSLQEQNILKINVLKEKEKQEKIETDNLKKKLQNLQIQISTFQNQLEQNASKIDFLEKIQKFQSTQIDQYQQKLNNQERYLNELQEQIVKLKSLSKQDVININFLKNQLLKYKNIQSQFIKNIDSLQNTVKQLQLELREIRLQKYEEKIQDAQQQQLKLREQLNLSQESLKSLKFENELIQQLLSKLKDQILRKEKTEYEQKVISSSKSKLLSDLNQILMGISHIVDQRKQDDEITKYIQMTIDTNVKQQQQCIRLNQQSEFIQQKAKIVSQDFQKMKTNVLKQNHLNVLSKNQIINFLLPIQDFVNKLFYSELVFTKIENNSRQQNHRFNYTFQRIKQQKIKK